ncbi:MAG TPA: hypothetical protein VKP03_02155 [Patescibacteria group bacterium]|nr:hypothetical protein [Patescibacteria group bacterium]
MIKKIYYKHGAGWIFLFLVLSAYALVGALRFDLFQEIAVYFKNTFIQVLPALILVFVITFLVNLFLDPKKLEKFFKTKTDYRSWMAMVILGVLSIGPIYMWYPVLADLKEKGLKNSLIAVFLYNRAIKPALIPMIVLYFGWPYLLIMTGLMIIFSLLNGLAVGKLAKK